MNREATLGKGWTASIEDRNKFIGNEMKRVLKRIFNSEDGKKVLISNNNINNYLLLSTSSNSSNRVYQTRHNWISFSIWKLLYSNTNLTQIALTTSNYREISVFRLFFVISFFLWKIRQKFLDSWKLSMQFVLGLYSNIIVFKCWKKFSCVVFDTRDLRNWKK